MGAEREDRDLFTPIADHLYRIDDTCNVYLIKEGNRAILIDSGSGNYLDELQSIGVSEIEWVLHTHHHRDQCSGDLRMRSGGAKIAVPEFEHYLFEQAEEFWSYKRIYDNYNSRNTFFTVGENIPVDAVLKDYEAFTWREVTFQIGPAKGHTNGSLPAGWMDSTV
jgi:glyoxylase-like metal-dependent hydrolase (beta-lactamase superfamily II)